ncbi:MAG TPA: hypothetical protein VNZ52_00585 [Candidatus Thermoplasmatota archaeon]|nr:hypothetical protein [Candidatus Thermoplasmatota archaeon]
MLARTLLFTAFLALTAAPLPLAGVAVAAPTCFDSTDPTASPVAEGYYFSSRDASLWRNTNSLDGIQRDRTYCYEYVNGQWVTTVIEADQKIAGAPNPGSPGLPVDCQLRPPMCKFTG